MLSFGQIFKSKTVWTTILMGAFNVWQVVSPIVPPHAAGIVNTIMAGFAAMFRIFPTQQPPAVQK